MTSHVVGVGLGGHRHATPWWPTHQLSLDRESGIARASFVVVQAAVAVALLGSPLTLALGLLRLMAIDAKTGRKRGLRAFATA